MKYLPWMSSALLLFLAVGSVDLAVAGEGSLRGAINRREAVIYPWHGSHYHTAWGAPVAVVVPPTVESHTDWRWGIGGTRVTPIRHQFGRSWPGPGLYDRSRFRHTPRWPNDTRQFGAYYIRGPW